MRIWPPADVADVTVPGADGMETASVTKPLIRLDEFRFHAPLRYKPGEPIRIAVVQLRAWTSMCRRSRTSRTLPRRTAAGSPGRSA